MAWRQPSRRTTARIPGRCAFCGAAFAQGDIDAHLLGCVDRRKGRSPALLVEVQSAEWSGFWLRVEIGQRSTLERLDGFLRAIWLECCGHLSAFDIGGVRYEPPTAFAYDGFGPRARSMSAKVADVLPPGTSFRYQYDFGSTTRLVGRSLRAVDDGVTRPAVRLAGRNDPPDLACTHCGAPAVSICTFCDAGPLCASCVDEHLGQGEDEAGLLPVVNSPRMGVCGYTGPLE